MLLVTGIHLDLIVTLESIHERHAFITACVVIHDAGDGKREFALGTCLIKISEVNCRFGSSYSSWRPRNFLLPSLDILLPDETRIYELLDFRLDRSHDFGTEASLWLSDYHSLRINV